MKHGIRVVVLASALVAACSADDPAQNDALSAGTDFVAVTRATTPAVAAAVQSFSGGGGSASVVIQDGDSNFYLAIKKSSLSQKWFLSAYVKQWFPDDVNAFAESTLGTRVVSFKIQNDKLFVFDVSDQFHNSDLLDPTILVEAWPVVHSDAFDRMRHSEDYVLVDPSAGLNRFQVSSAIFSDPNQGKDFSVPFHVGLAFLQGFRQLADGAVFEEVFEGDLDLAQAGLSPNAWGTLGITLRKYFEGPGYQQIPAPDVPHYFLSDQRLIPGSEGATTANPIHWNFHKGMKPIDVYITEGAFRAQADFPDVDLLGAFKRGIETWNDVFGFPVFHAVLVHSDAVPDDDKSFLLIDYPGNSGFAFANERTNPNTGETRGMSVYFSGVFLSDLPFFDDDPTVRAAQARPTVRSLVWGGMPAHKPSCVYWAPAFRERIVGKRGDSKLTAQQKGANFIQHVIAHEVGHTLGLRHNFEGSLEPPSSSIMDYLDELTDATATPDPRPYDRDAIRYLYGLSTQLPDAHPFCTDQDTAVSPICQIFDSGADPLYDWWVGNITFLEGLILDRGFPTDFLDTVYLNETLEFARDVGFVSPQERTDAILASLDRTLVPMSPADAADPDVVAQANLYAEAVLRRIVLDPPSARGLEDFDLSDPGAIGVTASQAGAMLRNEDGVRTLQLRRVTVAVLKALQADAAFLELRKSATAISAALDAGDVPADQVPFEEDLLAAVQSALTPYFDVN